MISSPEKFCERRDNSFIKTNGKHNTIGKHSFKLFSISLYVKKKVTVYIKYAIGIKYNPTDVAQNPAHNIKVNVNTDHLEAFFLSYIFQNSNNKIGNNILTNIAFPCQIRYDKKAPADAPEKHANRFINTLNKTNISLYLYLITFANS